MAARPGRGKKYKTLPELKSATRAWCLEQVERRSGHPWTNGDEATLRDDVTEPESAAVWAGLQAAVSNARAFVERRPNDDDVRAGMIRLVLQRLPAALVPNSSGPDRFRWTTRKLIVLEYDRRGAWWWHEQRPTPRDLAILSILAGEFPDWARKRLRKNVHTTVLEAVAAEERAIRQAQRKLAERTKRARAARVDPTPDGVSTV
jgi:hypothetical protein